MKMNIPENFPIGNSAIPYMPGRHRVSVLMLRSYMIHGLIFRPYISVMRLKMP